MIDQILEYINEDKYQNLGTTSNKFKSDLWKFFFEPKFTHKRAIEFGTHKGQTTRVLAHLFDHVVTINRDMAHLSGAMNFNKDLSNIQYLPFDLYAQDYTVRPTDEAIDVFFIDAGHDLAHVEMDVARALHMNLGDEVYFVFDDYGMMPGVRTVIDSYVSAGIFSIVATIGHEAGHNFGGTPARILRDSEGVICKLNKDMIEYE